MGEDRETGLVPDPEIDDPALEDTRIDSLRREDPIIRRTIAQALEQFGVVESFTADTEEEIRAAMARVEQKPDDLYIFKPEFEATIAVDEISRLLGTSILLGQSPQQVTELASTYLNQLDSSIDYFKSASGRLPIMYAHDIDGERIKEHVGKSFLFVDRQSAELIADHHPDQEIRQLIKERVLSENSGVRLDGIFSFSNKEPQILGDKHLREKPSGDGIKTRKIFYINSDPIKKS